MNFNGMFLLFRKTEKNSCDQLGEDFTHYPPLPLKGSIDRHIFKVVLMRPYLFSFKRIGTVIETSVEVLKGKNARLIEELPEEVVTPLCDARGSLEKVRNEFRSLKKYEKPIALLGLVIISPLFVGYIFFKLFGLYLKERKSLKKLQGFFSNLPGPDGINNELIINSKLTKKGGEELEAVISHEHVHFLQSLNSMRIGKEKFDPYCLSKPKLLISEKSITKHHIVEYLYKESEVEARLHEIVVSYYRKFGQLPTTVDGFAKMIFLNLDVSLAMRDPSAEGVVRKRWVEKMYLKEDLYSTRSKGIDFDIYLMCDAVKDVESGIKYVYEVLPIFYARLLSYYGDKETAYSFSCQLTRPNFYDQLYL